MIKKVIPVDDLIKEEITESGVENFNDDEHKSEKQIFISHKCYKE